MRYTHLTNIYNSNTSANTPWDNVYCLLSSKLQSFLNIIWTPTWWLICLAFLRVTELTHWLNSSTKDIKPMSKSEFQAFHFWKTPPSFESVYLGLWYKVPPIIFLLLNSDSGPHPELLGRWDIIEPAPACMTIIPQIITCTGNTEQLLKKSESMSRTFWWVIAWLWNEATDITLYTL